jgi:hypothetical protein
LVGSDGRKGAGLRAWSSRCLQDSRQWINYPTTPPAWPDSTIEVVADGSVKIKDLPDAYVDGFGRGAGGFVSGSGTWLMERSNEGFGLELTMRPGGTMPQAIYSSTSIRLKGRDPPYHIELTLCDPDTRRHLEFTKRVSNSLHPSGSYRKLSLARAESGDGARAAFGPKNQLGPLRECQSAFLEVVMAIVGALDAS